MIFGLLLLVSLVLWVLGTMAVALEKEFLALFLFALGTLVYVAAFGGA